MFGKRSTSSKSRSSALRSQAVVAAIPSCVVEPLEGRQLMSASLVVENLDIVPGYERMVFTKIANLDQNTPNTFKDKGILKLKNVGDEPLELSNLNVSGPFQIVGSFPTAIAPGASANVTVKFNATTPPAFTYNQTAGLTNQTQAGAHIGSLTFATNDAANATFTEGLAGWFQTHSEKNNEPSLQTTINLLLDYKTNIAPPHTTFLSQGSEAQYYGEEVVSGYWQRVNPAKSVGVRQIAAYHGQGQNVPVSWFNQGSNTNNLIFRHDGAASQTLLPNILGGTAPAAGSFTTNSPFGFKVDNSFSDDTKNARPQFGGGHEVRFFPVRDHFGNAIAGTFFMVQDYSIPVSGSVPNYDFQDNIYIVTNIMPAGSVVTPPAVPPTIPPAVPPVVPPPTPPTVPPTIPPTVPPTVPPVVPPTVPPTVPPAVPPAVPPTVPPVTTGVPVVSITPGSQTVVEAISGQKAVQLTVSLSEASSQKVKVRFSTPNGGAVRGADFVKAVGQLKFEPGQTSKTITVMVKSDQVAEADENFSVNLFDAKNADIGAGVSTITIQDNGVHPPSAGAKSIPAAGASDLPIISISPALVSVVEGNAGTQLVTFNVSIDRSPAKTVKLKYATANGSAVSGTDYKHAAGKLAFAPGGPTSKTITVEVKGDSTIEADEDFHLSLLSIKNGVFASDSAKVIVANDDA
ncbi:Calx-beta domain-containing protein [Humisphaera borealis]|uniref:Calx-beta domain-containing protein n=1 Tax=Humisphaera borealis TaxID=2807512 RepID=A0A7M2WV11_9BACT|nr:Calx-beta domain-containing protein [Humisphaera borealis]QOV89263.1 hypothetical protein IPV69_24145 [Humisphaera borealis]